MTTIDNAKQRFRTLLADIEREMDASIAEVHIVKQTAPSTFNGKAYERQATKVTIIFE